MILLDTSVLIAPVESWPHDEIGASALALAELQFGVQAGATVEVRMQRMRRLAGLRRLFDWIPFDEAAADSYGVLAALVRKQRPVHARSKDILMAAQAHALGASFLTRNPRDFELVADHVHIVDASA